jgi:hypothetical protein
LETLPEKMQEYIDSGVRLGWLFKFGSGQIINRKNFG